MKVPRILLVDDQREVSRMLRASLELSGRGYVVVDVPSGEEALLEIGRGPFDLLVTDFRLPGITGLELMAKVRRLNPEARTILITDHPSEKLQKQAEGMGAVAYLPKPISPDLFVEVVDRALRLRSPLVSPVQVGEGERRSLSQRFDSTRAALGAQALFLMDDRGEVVLQAGETSSLDLDPVLSPLLTLSNTGLKISDLMGNWLPGNMYYLDGERHDLYLTHVGAFYSLLIVFQGERKGEPLQSVVKAGRRAAEEWMDLLSMIQTVAEPERGRSSGQPPESEPAADTGASIEGEDDLSELEAAAKDLGEADAADFWEQVASQAASGEEGGEGMLTFRQAREMGLISEELDQESSEKET